MIKIEISGESRFPVNRKLLREVIEQLIAEQKIKSKMEVGVLIVGDRKMRELNKKYRNLNETTPVLSFSLENEKPFVNPPDKILRLGDIVISYPQTVALAGAENKLVDQKIGELVRHGLSNLLGLL